jgi:hypothetical protein
MTQISSKLQFPNNLGTQNTNQDCTISSASTYRSRSKTGCLRHKESVRVSFRLPIIIKSAGNDPLQIPLMDVRRYISGRIYRIIPDLCPKNTYSIEGIPDSIFARFDIMNSYKMYWYSFSTDSNASRMHAEAVFFIISNQDLYLPRYSCDAI